jgi:hypothetical protein
VRALPVEQLLARLEDRFRLLTGGARTAPARHQTLRATVDWSYALLAAPERALFARLSVFAGGWTLAAAEAVGAGEGVAAGDVLDRLTRLADRSLVVMDEPPAGAARYRLLETLRQYAGERLGAGGGAAGARRRHAAYFLTLAERAEPRLRGPPQLVSGARLARLEVEHDNLRAALGWALESGETGPGLRLAAALAWFWLLRRHLTEGRAWFAALLAAPGAAARDAPRARALEGAALLAQTGGDAAGARRLLDESLALARALGDDALAARALQTLGYHARWRGDYAAAQRSLEAALALHRRRGDDRGAAEALCLLGRVAHWRGEPGPARARFAEALATARRLGDRRAVALTLQRQGELLGATGDPGGARRTLDEALALFRALGGAAGVAAVQVLLGRLDLRQGDPAARERFVAGLRAAQEAGYPWGAAEGLEGLAAAAAAAGRPARALRLAGAAAALRDHLELRLPPAEREELERWLAPAHAALAPAAAAAAWAAGQSMPLEAAVADALADAPAST